jgi:hypothetical protein
MKTEITIIPCTGEYPLYQMYPHQCNPQDAYIQLDPDARELSADWNAEIDNSIPMSVYHVRKFRYSVSQYLHTSEVIALMDDIKPLALRVCDGYNSEWDGHNNVGILTDDATEAHEQIDVICREATACDSRHDGTEPWFE